jgi:hypothetical protein
VGGGGRHANLRGAHLAYLAASQALAVRHSQGEFNKEDKEFDALEWLAAMCSHVPNKGEQMVRYYGHYSNVSRGKRKKRKPG